MGKALHISQIDYPAFVFHIGTIYSLESIKDKKETLEDKNETLEEKNESHKEKNESFKEGRKKVLRTRIQIIVLKTLKRIIFLCRKLRKDDKFLRMSLGLHPQDIPQN